MFSRFSRIALLLIVASTGLCVQGCGTGSTDSGPTAAGSGAPAPSSGTAGSTPATPTPGRDR